METPQHAGCEDYRESLRSRRTFLKGAGVLAGGGVLATMHGTAFGQTAFAASGKAESVLVVVNLRGGADGMSLVVPYGDDGYARARPTIAVAPRQLLQTDGMFGLHPGLGALEPLWKTGRMAAVQAVGLPAPNRSHLSATEEVAEADPGSTRRAGWLNRMVGMTEPAYLFGAVQVGWAVPGNEIHGRQPALAAMDIENIRITGPAGAISQRKAALDVTWGHAPGPLGRAARDGMQAAARWRPVVQTPRRPEHGARYPKSDLGRAMAQSARLVKADVGAEVISVDHSSWDMHTDVGTLDDGEMRVMADDLARSLAAFFTDLGSLGSLVTLVTISEFGRRVAENGDAGLDHGYGNAMLVMGGGVRGGRVYGSWPGLDPWHLVDGDLAVTTDYRSVLWEVVEARFGSVSLARLFPGFRPQRLGMMRRA
ncbi:MAG: hypothetical protein QOI51_1002 [Nocardioidaceae bacterium]|jgi:uncharacterized protein (DUF1501 family)|nr:hypothetical protein [Nocardioidaceae bacterium]MDX6308526.1 hypothetical protein [Nocardioidaceae bacterium]